MHVCLQNVKCQFEALNKEKNEAKSDFEEQMKVGRLVGHQETESMLLLWRFLLRVAKCTARSRWLALCDHLFFHGPIEVNRNLKRLPGVECIG